jgi:hypothetical protein
MAMMKYGAATVVNPVVAPGKWLEKKVSPGRKKIAKQIIGQHDVSDWLLTHVTIMASVDCDYADPKDPKSNYLIKPEHSIFVNNNGDSWERSLLAATYKTFLTADNFVEHVQIPELSKGKILDVALREVPFTKDKDGNDVTTLYVDILIATNRKHVDLIRKIESGEYSAVSMGCLIKYSQCSQCGNIAADETEACKHIRYYKGNHFFDKQGVKRVIAELCGRVEEPDSCVFIDASWVRKPAFEGAVLRNIVDVKQDPNNQLSDKIQQAVMTPGTVNDIQFADSNLLARAASSEIADVRANSAKEAASILMKELQADEEGGDSAPDPAPEPEAPADDTPAEDSGSDDLDAPLDDSSFPEAPEDTGAPAEEAGPSLGDAPTESSPAPAEEPVIDEPAEDATTKEVKDMFKKQILNDLRRDLLKQQAKTDIENRPSGLENDINESLVRDASIGNVLSSDKDVDTYVKKALYKDAGDSERLKNGLIILANLKDWSRLKKYGYSRDDVLGMLCYVDQKTASEPLELNMVKALSKVKLASNDLKSFFTEIIFETGHKPGKTSAKKLASWARILNSLE